MTGKSYSIKEMKAIVDHLTENKLYGEIRGRKMWMDYANSSTTTRTWQSLKETFLKRILPDIHNPYYKLDMAQINSFRSGYDVSDRNKNKLEVHPVSDDSGSNGPNQKETAKSNSDNGIKEEINAGEIVKCSKIAKSRSSADTVIVDTCYETAEDIQKDLESPRGETENGETKSLRDCITYSEPLTPMVQEVLDDFQSEPENEPEASDREAQMEITDTVPDDTEKTGDTNKDEPRVVKENGKSDHVTNDASKKETDATDASGEVKTNPKEIQANNKQSKEAPPPESDVQKEPEILCLDDSPAEENEEKSITEKKTSNKTKDSSKTPIAKNDESLVINNTENTDVVVVHNSNSEIIQPSGGLSNSTMTDASLPNNPEALTKRLSNEKAAEENGVKVIEDVPSPKSIADNKVTRKRSNSEDTAKNAGNKKTKLNKTKSKATSETEGRENMETITEGKSKPISKQKEVKATSNNKEKDVPTDDTIVKNLANILEKPSTSITDDVDQVLLSSESDSNDQINDSSEIKNPCLQNVSLFDEQFNKLKYGTSESEVDQNKKKNQENKDDKNEQESQNDVVMLKSHTESDSEEIRPPPKKKLRAGVVSTKTDRDKALANVFGFSSGASYSQRRRQLSRRRRTISQNNASHNKGGSDSSQWTSESESEVYVSPPRSRKNRHTKKYLKPQSGRILSLEEEGGLFVMHGKKIYPLVRDGKLVKNYLTYLPESDSEEEENYWRIKYEEEKKKADELKKLLQKAKESHSRRSASNAPQPNPLRSSTCCHNDPENNKICLPGRDGKKVETKPTVAENIKIKFTTKNDQEIHLEGNWPQLHDVLDHVVHMFHKPEPVQSKVLVEPASSSGIATPVIITAIQEPAIDPEVHEKVNKIESEIFKEIEERDKEEQSEPNVQDVNITKRKAGRPRRFSPSSSAAHSPAKRPKTTNESPTKEPEASVVNEKAVNVVNEKTGNVVNEKTGNVVNEKTGNVVNDKTEPEPKSDVSNDTVKRQTRTPRRNLNESVKETEVKPIQTRRSKLSLSEVSKENGDDDNVRYMFPPKNTRATKNAKPQKSTTKAPKIYSSPETICSNSVESTQGYQDSDPSPFKMELRKKKKINLSEYKAKTKSHARRIIKKANPNQYCDESSNSSVGEPIKEIERDNSSLNTDVYRSESYQLLMPVKSSFRHLDPIDETSPIRNEVDYIKHLDSTDKNEFFSIQMTSDIGSSSNISLPLSPELSVVESMSISKEMLNDVDIGPTINEMQCNEIIIPTTCSQYMITDIDVSVPLMQQECELESCNEVDNKYKSLVTNSLLNKIGDCNIKDQTTLTETLDAKLRDLLLESAKKIAAHSEQINMDVDETKTEGPKKVKNKNRCSTPRKRKVSQKSKKAPKVPPVVEEEHVETYAKSGRKSCPPIIEANPLELDVVNEEIKIADLTINDNKPKGRKKKDVIKVKILKPKAKKSHNDTKKSVKNSKKSIVHDSGINETESGEFLCGDESVDLIHNHSETCLHTNDCVRDSIEFVENSMKSILTLSDSNQSYDNMVWNNECGFDKATNISPDFFCCNARDVKGFFNINSNGCEKVPTPKTDSSLITEDLSDDPPEPPASRPNKWYLLSEDETSNTHMPNTQDPLAKFTNLRANLQQIFPITCAVPDLSTITEMSNENSRKPTTEGNGDTLDSQMFDSNF